jgi:hypothetical protein
MKETNMIFKLLDLIKQYSFAYKNSMAFRTSLYFFIEHCNDNKKVASILFNELKECLGEDCIGEVLSEEELEEILKIIA